MNNTELLSICIPTFNRALFLKQSIDNMIPVLKCTGIQIYVSDNASPDETEKIMNEYVREYDFIHYHRHLENVGPDDNFEYVLKMSNTKYRWLMSDTSFVDDIDTLITDLLSNEWDAYIANDARSVRYERLPHKKILYNESISVMRDIGWHLTWISCMIYNERLVNSLNFERYKDSCFNQTALLFDPTANRTCQICFNPNLRVKSVPLSKESAWHYQVFDVFYRKWYLLVMSLPVYYPYEVKMKCIIENNKADVLFFRMHADRRLYGKWTAKDVIRNKFFIKQSKANYYGLLLLGIAPKWLISIIWNSGKMVKKMIRLFGVKI